MGVLFDYFAADSDEQAASTIDWPGGPMFSPTLPTEPPPPVKRGLFRRRPDPVPEPAMAVEGAGPLDALSGKGIDPVVMMGTFEELLTGRPYDDIVADPRSGKDLAIRDGGERLVLTLTDSLTAALATSTRERLTQVAIQWSQTEEFWGQGDPVDLSEWLWELALARRAGKAHQRLYCWVCV